MEFLSFLENISPWWWIAFAFVIGAIEMLTGTFVLIWLGLAAFSMAIILVISPGLSGELQIAIFAGLCVVLTFIGRGLLSRFGDGGKVHETLNQRSNLVVGRTAKVLEIDNGEGIVEIEGMRWRARLDGTGNFSIGDKVRVVDADGMTLDVAAL